MSSSIYLVLDLEGNETFDSDSIRHVISNLPGVCNCKDENQISWTNSLLLDCEIELNGDTTFVSLSRDLKCVTIGGTGNASLASAIEIQCSQKKRIFAVLDGAIGIHADLTKISSMEDLQRKFSNR